MPVDFSDFYGARHAEIGMMLSADALSPASVFCWGKARAFMVLPKMRL